MAASATKIAVVPASATKVVDLEKANETKGQLDMFQKLGTFKSPRRSNLLSRTGLGRNGRDDEALSKHFWAWN